MRAMYQIDQHTAVGQIHHAHSLIIYGFFQNRPYNQQRSPSTESLLTPALGH